MGFQVAYQVNLGVYYFIRALQAALCIYVVLTWVARPYSKVYIFFQNLVSPLLAPFRPLSRKLIEKGLMVDLSALMAIIALNLLQYGVSWLIFRLFY